MLLLNVELTEATDGAGSFLLRAALNIEGGNEALSVFNSTVLLANSELVLDLKFNSGGVVVGLLSHEAAESAGSLLGGAALKIE